MKKNGRKVPKYAKVRLCDTAVRRMGTEYFKHPRQYDRQSAKHDFREMISEASIV